MHPRTVDDPADDLAHVVRRTGVHRHHVVQALGVLDGLRWLIRGRDTGRSLERSDN